MCCTALLSPDDSHSRQDTHPVSLRLQLSDLELKVTLTVLDCAQEQEKADRLNSALEGSVLAALCVSLWLVLRRRRTLRAAATASPAGPSPPGGAAAAEQAPQQGTAEPGAPSEQRGSGAQPAAAPGPSTSPEQRPGGSRRPASRLALVAEQGPRGFAAAQPAARQSTADAATQTEEPGAAQASRQGTASEAVQWHNNQAAAASEQPPDLPCDSQQSRAAVSAPLSGSGWESLDAEALLAALELQQHALLGKQLYCGQAQWPAAAPAWCEEPPRSASSRPGLTEAVGPLCVH